MAPRQITTAPNLTVDLEQVYRNNRWEDTLRTTNSRFNNPVTLPGGRVVPAQPARILREQSVNGTTLEPRPPPPLQRRGERHVVLVQCHHRGDYGPVDVDHNLHRCERHCLNGIAP